MLAVAPSPAYRARKFARRHWRGLIAATLALIGICGGAGVSIYQARIAQQRFHQVRKLAGRFIAMHDDVAHLPGSTAVRAKLVATALDYLDGLSRSAGSDAGLLDEIAQAYAKVGDAQGAPGQPNLGRIEDSLLSYRKAIAFEGRAVEINPGYRLNLAKLQAAFAYDAMLSGYLADARHNLEAAAAALQRLRTSNSSQDPELLLLQARVAVRRGDLQEYEGRANAMLPFYQEARHYAAEYAKIKQDDKSREFLHLLFGLEANALEINGRYEEALAVLHQGEPIIDALLAAEPDNPRYLRQKMSEANFESTIYFDENGSMGKPAEAIEAGRRYVALAQRLVDADPNNAGARLSLAIALYRLSYPLSKIAPEQALAPVERALSIFDQGLSRTPYDRLLRSRRARALRYQAHALQSNNKLAQAREAAAQAVAIQRQLLAEAPSDASERQQLALSQKVLESLKPGHM